MAHVDLRALAFLPLLALAACPTPELGDPCTVDDDCAPDLVCHTHEGEEEGFCDTEEHDDDHDHEGEDHEGEDHEGEDHDHEDDTDM